LDGAGLDITWGLILIVVTGVFGWLIQAINALAPATAEKLGLNEPEADVDATFYADTRGEAIWDALSVWVLPVAGVLLVMGHDAWAYFGLVGGGIYLYFAGRGLIVRLIMQHHDIRIGKKEQLKLYYAYLILAGLIAIVTIAMAVAELS
jgi:hypothetical protein